MTFYDFCMKLVKGFCHTIFRIKVEGIENIPEDGAFLICPNHKSNFDPPIIAISVPFNARFMAKEELFKFKPFGALMRALGAFPIKRGKNDIGALKSTIKMLENGERVVIFPEGRRSKKSYLCKGKQGAALIATRTATGILPVGIEGEYKLFHKITIRIGNLISLKEYEGRKATPDELQEITDERLMPAIAELAGVKTYEDRDC